MYVGRLVRRVPSKSGRSTGSGKPATGASGESALEGALQKLDGQMKAALQKLDGQMKALDQRLTLLELRNGIHPRTEDASILKSCLAKLDGELDGRAKAGALLKLDLLERGTMH